jgi:hypothetical protein
VTRTLVKAGGDPTGPDDTGVSPDGRPWGSRGSHNPRHTPTLGTFGGDHQIQPARTLVERDAPGRAASGLAAGKAGFSRNAPPAHADNRRESHISRRHVPSACMTWDKPAIMNQFSAHTAGVTQGSLRTRTRRRCARLMHAGPRAARGRRGAGRRALRRLRRRSSAARPRSWPSHWRLARCAFPVHTHKTHTNARTHTHARTRAREHTS